MYQEKNISAFVSSGKTMNCIAYFTDTLPWKINIDCGAKGVFQSEESDLFEAYVNLRKILLNEEIDLLCNGSRRNIYPSPMLRESSGGKMAYLLRVGVPARTENIVSIFDPIERSDIATINEQKDFYGTWLKSLDPTPKEIEEALKHPNGWVYRIDGDFSDDEKIPPSAIIGACEITGV